MIIWGWVYNREVTPGVVLFAFFAGGLACRCLECYADITTSDF